MKRTFETIENEDALKQELKKLESTSGNHLFLIRHGEYGEGSMRLFSYASSNESLRTFLEVTSDLDERSRCGDDWIAWDIFIYLCGEWEGERPPAALPLSLWFTPREELGTWVEIEATNNFRMIKGPWASIIESQFFGELKNVDDHESRAISESDWNNQVEFEASEIQLAEERLAAAGLKK